MNYKKFYNAVYPNQYNVEDSTLNVNYKNYKATVNLSNSDDACKLYNLLLSQINISDLDKELLEARYNGELNTLKSLSDEFKLSDSRIQQRLSRVIRKLKHPKNLCSCLIKFSER